MARFQLESGAIVDTDRAAKEWEEATFFDGRDHISKATGSKWDHETRYKSSKGRYYLVRSSQWQGSRDQAEEQSPMHAARWLLHNEHELPEYLVDLEEEILE